MTDPGPPNPPGDPNDPRRGDPRAGDSRYDEVRYDDQPRDGDGDGDGGGGGGRGWMIATIGIIAALVGLGVGLLIDSGDSKTKTVHAGKTHTVTVATSPATTSVGVTVKQPDTVTVRSPPETVTVTVPAEGDTQTTP